MVKVNLYKGTVCIIVMFFLCVWGERTGCFFRKIWCNTTWIWGTTHPPQLQTVAGIFLVYGFPCLVFGKKGCFFKSRFSSPPHLEHDFPDLVVLPQRVDDEGAPAPVGHVEKLPVEVSVDVDGDGGAGGLGLSPDKYLKRYKTCLKLHYNPFLNIHI